MEELRKKIAEIHRAEMSDPDRTDLVMEAIQSHIREVIGSDYMDEITAIHNQAPVESDWRAKNQLKRELRKAFGLAGLEDTK